MLEIYRFTYSWKEDVGVGWFGVILDMFRCSFSRSALLCAPNASNPES